MARFIVDIPTPYAPQHVEAIFGNFCMQEGFKPEMKDNEVVMTKGDGFIAIRQYVKLYISPGMVHLEAWIKNIGGWEQNYEGFVGVVQKAPAKTKIDNLVATINGRMGVYAVPPPPVM